MDDHLSGHVITLVNSIIGVSILAMPYCFKQCGIILAVLMILISNLLTRVTCHFLMKSANITRRRTFEHLAFHTFGCLGKFGIEIGMIGFLIGTCIAFFVVMGDLGPEIISEITRTYTSNTMRTSILMALALFCVLPLGLLRNVDSLIGVSKATVGFYICLILKIILEALPHLFQGDWVDKVNLWRPLGVLQVLPIFSMALSCQTQLFEIYQAVEHPTLEKMNQVVKSAVNICTGVYIFVGFFGYVAFAQKAFGGNILMTFAPSFVTNAMKLGFILSLAFSFPLVIFPCRQSLYSLLYREGYSLHESMSNYIPEGKFKGLTMFIVLTSLVVAILIPTIEIVLGLVGSTIGVMICLIFPVTCFICTSYKDTNERLVAKLVLILAIFIMVLGTYTNLKSLEKIESPIVENQNKNILPLKEIKAPSVVVTDAIFSNEKNYNISKPTGSPEVRHEPPQPVELPEERKKKIDYAKPKENHVLKSKVSIKKLEDNNKKIANKEKQDQLFKFDIPKKEIKHTDPKIVDSPPTVQTFVINESKVFDKKYPNVVQSKQKQDDQVDIEAIKKDDLEMNLESKEEKSKHHVEEDHKILLETIQKQHEVQESLVKQQQKLIEVIEKQEKEKHEKIEKEEEKVAEEKMKAVKAIQNMALHAIERISGGDKDINKESSNNLETKVKDVQESPKVNIEKKMEVEGVENGNSNGFKENKVLNIHQEDPMKNLQNSVDIKNNTSTATKQPVGVNNTKIVKKSENIIKETKQKLDEIEKEFKKLNPELAVQKNSDLNKKQNSTDDQKLNGENRPKIEKSASAPLLKNLGQKLNVSVLNNKEKENPKAIPIAVRLINSSSNFTIAKDLKIHQDQVKNPHNSKMENEEVKVLRRDILSYSTMKKR